MVQAFLLRAFSLRPHLATLLLAIGTMMTAACGTLQISLEGTIAAETVSPPTTSSLTPAVTPTPFEAREAVSQGESVEAVSWYGQVHSIDAANPNLDYLKLWHLNLWPKFGRAIGLAGADTAVDAEIARIRDRDVKARFWGTLSCGVGDYGACQLLVTRLSASDGGPSFEPDSVDGWQGTIGRLPERPDSEGESLYFTLAGEVPVLYGIASEDLSIQAELERLLGSEEQVRIWGEVQSQSVPVTGSKIIVERLESVPAAPSD